MLYATTVAQLLNLLPLRPVCKYIKTTSMEYRIEKDTMGEVKVPADAMYGAQTQRSIDNFKIAHYINKMQKDIIKVFAY